MANLRGSKLHPLSLGGVVNLPFAQMFNRRASAKKAGTTNDDAYGGFLFRTAATRKMLTTTIIDPPAEVVGPSLFLSPDLGQGTFVYNRVLFDRGYLYPEAGAGVPPDDASSQDPVGTAVPAEELLTPVDFSLGEAPPAEVYIVAQNNAGRHLLPTQQSFFGGECTLVADRPFSFLLDDLPADPATKLWVIYTVRFGARKVTRFSVSEAWMQRYLPGYRFLNFSGKFTLALPQMRVVPHGERFVFLTTVRKEAGGYDAVTNDRDYGACAMLVASVAPDDSGQYLPQWASTYTLEANSDIRQRAVLWEDYGSEYIPTGGYGRGYNQNSIIPDLAIGEDGTTYCGVVVNTARMARADNDGSTPTDLWGNFLGQVCSVFTWAPAGARSVQELRAYADVPKITYDRAAVRPQDADFIVWADAFDVDLQSLADDVTIITQWCKVVHDGENIVALCDDTRVKLSTPSGSFPEGYAPVTTVGAIGQVLDYSYKITGLGESTFGIMTKYSLAGGELFSWSTPDTGVAILPGDGLFKSDALQMTQGLRNIPPAPTGVQWFGGIMGNTPKPLLRDPVYARVNLLPPYDVVAKRIPRDFTGSGFIWAMPVHFRTEDTPESVYLSYPLSTYVSADGGETWTRIAAGGLNTGVFTGNALWDRPAMNIRL